MIRSGKYKLFIAGAIVATIFSACHKQVHCHIEYNHVPLTIYLSARSIDNIDTLVVNKFNAASGLFEKNMILPANKLLLKDGLLYRDDSTKIFFIVYEDASEIYEDKSKYEIEVKKSGALKTFLISGVSYKGIGSMDWDQDYEPCHYRAFYAPPTEYQLNGQVVAPNNLIMGIDTIRID